MEQKSISAPEFKVGRWRAGPMKRHGRRFLLIALVLSVVVHLSAALLIVLLPRPLPRKEQSREEGAVKLLIIEQKGAEPGQADQPKDTMTVPRPSEKKATPTVKDSKNEVVTPRSTAALAPPPPEQTERGTAEANRSPGGEAAKAQPSSPRSQEGQFSISVAQKVNRMRSCLVSAFCPR
jgi:cytoskeletal protein RodZ